MPFPKYTKEQAAARAQADEILRAAGLPTWSERNADFRQHAAALDRRWTQADALIRSLLQATSAHTEAPAYVRVLQAIRNDLNKRLKSIVMCHHGIR